MSAANSISASGASNPLGARAQYSQFSQAAAISGNDYNVGQGMSMNADTSKWGKMTSGSSFTNNGIISAVSNLSNQVKGMGSFKTQAKAQSGDYSFNIAGASMSVRSNYQDATFGGARRAQPKSNFRRGFALMALPEGAEGSWGSYDRKYVIGGNWKSNGDVDFATKHVTETLNTAEFDGDKVEVVVAPTDIHLTTVKSLADKKINVSA